MIFGWVEFDKIGKEIIKAGEFKPEQKGDITMTWTVD